ncbi:MFS transporter [Acidocella sp.]|jgi:putative MFS transporter|uniref:MFS transporter n=1 Tax=Acidocella sp. TaxID=50710 RepID=UPI002F40611B
MSFEALDSPKLRSFHRRLTILSAAGMFLDGFDLTVIAVALPFLVKKWAIGPGLTGVVASSAVVGMFFGALVLGHLTDRIGRKAMYVVDLICFVVFAALTAVSQNVWEFIAFRFLLGVGIGADYPISSTLLAEFVPAARRGAFVTAVGSSWFLGAVCAYLAGYLLLPLGPDAWRWMLVLGAAIALVVICFRAAIPESPRWLAAQGRHDEAGKLLLALSGETGTTTAEPSQPWLSLFKSPLLRLTIFVAGFWFCYDVAFYGISIYTPTILKNFTAGSASAAYLGAAIVSALGLLGAVIGVFLVDGWGRRKLIIFSFAGLTLMLIALAVEPKPALVILVLLFGLATLFSNMGPGVLNFVYPTEIFPTGVRAGATGFGTAISRVGAILAILVFPRLVHDWGLQAALWLFVVAAAVGLVICIAMAPETKRRTLEELNRRGGDNASVMAGNAKQRASL